MPQFTCRLLRFCVWVFTRSEQSIKHFPETEYWGMSFNDFNLTPFFSMFPFDSPENMRKTLVSWGSKGDIGKKKVKMFVYSHPATFWITSTYLFSYGYNLVICWGVLFSLLRRLGLQELFEDLINRFLGMSRSHQSKNINFTYFCQ